MKKFGKYGYQITKENFLQLQVCSDCPPEEKDKLLLAVQANNPSGTQNNWQLDKDTNMQPVKCELDSTRWHYMFIC